MWHINVFNAFANMCKTLAQEITTAKMIKWGTSRIEKYVLWKIAEKDWSALLCRLLKILHGDKELN